MDSRPAMIRPTWLPQIPPILSIVVAATVGMVLVVAATVYATQQPWLGLSFVKPQEFHYIEVEQVADPGPSADHLKPGDRITAITDASGRRIAIDTFTLVDEPNMLEGYKRYNAFFTEQDHLYKALNQLWLTATLDVGTQVIIHPWLERPLSALPFGFWLINFCGLAVFVMGVSVWSFQRGQIAPRVLAVAGSSYFVGALAAAIYATRELALRATDLRILTAANDLGIMVFGYSLVVLLWYYPKRLGKASMASIIYPAIIIGWFIALIQLPALAHAFYKYALVYLLILVFAYRQWRLTAHAPIERAALKWLLLTILITLGLAIILFYVPILVTGQPVASIVIPFALVFVLFLGLSLGVVKYRLFNLERWWLEAWFWLLGGFMVLLVDVTLVYFLELTSAPAFGLAVVLVGWLYFPLRQWLLGHVLSMGSRNPEHYVPDLIENLFSTPTSSDPGELFTRLLQKVFEPSAISEVKAPLYRSELDENGLVLRLPSLGTQTSLELASRNHGKRLFSPDDLRLADTLRAMAIKAVTTRRAEEEGARVERARIMRDLHDDVAARLLSLVHRASTPEQSEQARSALRALRDTIYSLDDNTRVDFHELLSDLSAEMREWLGETVRLRWDEPAVPIHHTLTPRQQINIRRIVQEALQNAVRHAEPAHIEVSFDTQGNGRQRRCHIRICNDGEIRPMDQWVAGKGLNNMRTRVGELDGEVEWSVDGDRCCVTIDFPLSVEKE